MTFKKNFTSFTAAGQGGAAGHHTFNTKTIEKSRPVWIRFII